MDDKNDHYYEVLNSIHASLHKSLTEAEINTTSAASIANYCVNNIIDLLGGQLIYFPKTRKRWLSDRDLSIYREFKGNNHVQLASKYNLSVPWIYKIIKEVTKDESARRQYTLDYFDDNYEDEG